MKKFHTTKGWLYCIELAQNKIKYPNAFKYGQHNSDDDIFGYIKRSTTNPHNLGYVFERDCKIHFTIKTKVTDIYLHDVLKYLGFINANVEIDAEGAKEWYYANPKVVKYIIKQIERGKTKNQIKIKKLQTYKPRPEQLDCIEQTVKMFTQDTQDKFTESVMLWFAKMRYGKTHTAYQVAEKMGFKKVLVITYKPQVHNSWKEDLEDHVAFQDWLFLSKDAETLTKSEIEKHKDGKIVAFLSYQALTDKDDVIKASKKFLCDVDWDLVIIDESHYGADTLKSTSIFSDDLIKSKHTLYLSGTPFKALAQKKFSEERIFSWTYTQEQAEKQKWFDDPTKNDADNPWAELASLSIFTHKMSNDLVKFAVNNETDEFSLNYFFKAEKIGNKYVFVNESAVNQWIDNICGINIPTLDYDDQIKKMNGTLKDTFIFGNGMFKLDHTLWYMNSVNSCLAMESLLNKHRIFKQYTIKSFTGESDKIKGGSESVGQAESLVNDNNQSIIITCGMLTTGTSIKQWTGCLFLSDVESPSQYFQTAFRVQTPYLVNKEILKKECYVFDFSPNRILRLLVSNSESLGEGETLQERIEDISKYMPIIAMDGNNMTSLNSNEIITHSFVGASPKELSKSLDACIIKNPDVSSNNMDILNTIIDVDLKKEPDDYAFDENGIIKKVKSKTTKGDPVEKDMTESQQKKLDEWRKNKVKTLNKRITLFIVNSTSNKNNLLELIEETSVKYPLMFKDFTGIDINQLQSLNNELINIDVFEGFIIKFKEMEKEQMGDDKMKYYVSN